MNLKTINLKKFTESTKIERSEFVDDLGQAFETIGFAAIEGHDFTSNDRDLLQKSIKSFFNQSQIEKMKSHDPNAKGQRGFTSFGTEHAKGEETPDLKEFFQWGPMDAKKRGLDENILVPNIPEMDETVSRAYNKLEAIGQDLMKAIALHLCLPEDFFISYLNQGHSIFRAIHYPGQTNATQNGIRAAAHEDINLITLLMGASAEGLELLSKEGVWLPIHVTSDVLVINVGDMLQRLTNNVMRSTTHRVVNPAPEKQHLPRFSMPFFVHPNEKMPLDCLNICVSDEKPKEYSNITAGEYLHQRLVEIGLA